MEIHISEHPLVAAFLTVMRNRETTPEQFTIALEQVSRILAVEATVRLPLRQVTVTTPLETTNGAELGSTVVLAPILRAGLGMLGPFRQVIPQALVAYLGMYRDEERLLPVTYYANIPQVHKGAHFLILDPMLATGGSAAEAISRILEQDPAEIRLVAVIGAPEGVELLRRRFPQVKLHLGALDRELNARGYILPGLGDAGDRLFGT